MGYRFRSVNRDQLYFLPLSLRDWLPEGHLAWFIIDAVDQMNLRPFLAKYRSDGWGGESYDPSMMVCLLLYAYCLGERSSRRIEQLCQEDVGFRVVSANQMPDHTTIARFRQRHEKELAGLFVEVLKLCREAGLLRVGRVALDGTKMEANASLSSNRRHEWIQAEVAKMLAEAEATDQEEDRTQGPGQDGGPLPEGLRHRQERLERLKACKERLEKEAEAQAAAQQRKLEERQAKEEAAGRKLRGRKPKAPDASVAEDAKANIVDPDSRIMKTRQGFVQGYNAQAVVTGDQIIIAAEVTQDCNDVHQLAPMMEQAESNLSQVGVEESIEEVVADAGYWSETNVTQTAPDDPELFIATTKDWKQRKALKEALPPQGPMPENLSPREQMEWKLLTAKGREVYATRGQTVEPTFGQIKDGRGCERFMRRGLPACDSEWKLLCLTHNLLKLWRRATEPLRRAIQQPITAAAVV